LNCGRGGGQHDTSRRLTQPGEPIRFVGEHLVRIAQDAPGARDVLELCSERGIHRQHVQAHPAGWWPYGTTPAPAWIASRVPAPPGGARLPEADWRLVQPLVSPAASSARPPLPLAALPSRRVPSAFAMLFLC